MSLILPLLHNLVARQDPAGDPAAEADPYDGNYTPDIGSQALWYEKSYLDGIFVGAVAYGVHATLFFITFKLLWQRPRNSWKDYIWITYIIALFTISSIGNGMQLKFAQMIWIDMRDYPGGPSTYFYEGSTNIIPVLGNIFYIINTWLQDGLLLYRFWIIFGKRVWVVVVPALVYLTSIVLAIVLCVMLTKPGLTIWSAIAFPVFTSYWSISIGFNVILTIAIVTRLLMMRNKIGKSIAGPYASISAMLIESAALYTVTATLFLVTYGVNSTIQNLVLPTMAQVQSIAPLLIIMRVAQGHAWTSETAARIQQSTQFGFSTGGRSGRTGQTDTYAMSNATYDQKGSGFTRSTGGISTRVDTVTWQDDNSGENKHQHVV